MEYVGVCASILNRCNYVWGGGGGVKAVSCDREYREGLSNNNNPTTTVKNINTFKIWPSQLTEVSWPCSRVSTP